MAKKSSTIYLEEKFWNIIKDYQSTNQLDSRNDAIQLILQEWEVLKKIDFSNISINVNGSKETIHKETIKEKEIVETKEGLTNEEPVKEEKVVEKEKETVETIEEVEDIKEVDTNEEEVNPIIKSGILNIANAMPKE